MVINEPDAWLVNLADHSAKHLLDRGPTLNCKLPIFAWIPKLPEERSASSRLGRNCFRANGAKLVERPKLEFKTNYHEVTIGDSVLRLAEPTDIASPVRFLKSVARIEEYSRKHQRPAPQPAFTQNLKRKLLLGGDGVFGCFRDAELYDRLGLDLDRFTSLWIAPQAGLAMSLHQAAQSRDYEDPVLLGLFNSDIGQLLEKCCGGLVVGLEFLRQMADELRLGQT